MKRVEKVKNIQLYKDHLAQRSLTGSRHNFINYKNFTTCFNF